jgi:ribosomal protein S18 acetylase RimI-like enzyme
MGLKIEKTKINEVHELLAIQKKAFRPDLKKYKDYKTNPASEEVDFLIYRINHSMHYTIFIDGTIAGGICIIKRSDTHFRLFRIFISPEYQNKGLGSNIISKMESTFPKVKTWSLNTPKDNRRNRHFYEKLGYKKNGEAKINDRLTLIEYKKKIT